ncbi:MAG: DUF4114 domain-containing protein [Planctomycetota bacterium]
MTNFQNLHLVFAALAIFTTPLNAQTTLQVKNKGSDARSIEFNNKVLPLVNQLLSGHLREGRTLQNANIGFRLDPNRLFLQKDYEPRIYFLGSVTANQLGFDAYIRPLGSSKTGGTRFKLFPNVRQLQNGDFVELGPQTAGTLIDPICFLNGRSFEWYTLDAKNIDLRQHVVAMTIDDFIVLGWEDAPGGGDNDFNDGVVVLDIGPENLDELRDPILPH